MDDHDRLAFVLHDVFAVPFDEIDILADPRRLRRLDLAVLDG